MRYFAAVIIAFLTLLSTDLASNATPGRHHNNPRGPKHRRHCLTKHEAEGLRDLFISFYTEPITDGGAKIRQSFTDDAKYFSQSSKSVTGFTGPLDADIPFFEGKEGFVRGAIHATATYPEYNWTVRVWDHGCDTFTFAWSAEPIPGVGFFAGINFMWVQKGSYLIEKVYVEYNSVQYLSVIGCKTVGGSCGINCPVCIAAKG